METSGPTLTAFRTAGWPGGSGTDGASAAAVETLESLCCWKESRYIHALTRAPTRRVPSTSQSLAD